MKIACFEPGVATDAVYEARLPRGIVNIASEIENLGHEVQVFIDSYKRIDWSTLNIDEIKAKYPLILEADLFCFSYIMHSRNETLDRVATLAKLNPSAVRIAGGQEVTMSPGREMNVRLSENLAAFDAVVLGEAEETIREIIHRIERGQDFKGLRGVWYRENGLIIKNKRGQRPDLNRISFPNYNLIIGYKPHIETIIGAETSRGCSERCDFCQQWLIAGPCQRYKNPDVVVEEMRRYPWDQLFFILDDHFGENKTRAKKLLKAWIKTGLIGPKIIQSSVKSNYRDPTIFDKKKRSSWLKVLWNIDWGFFWLKWKSGVISECLGIESISQKTLDSWNKSSTKFATTVVLFLMRWVFRIHSHGMFIVSPEDGIKDIDKNAKYAGKKCGSYQLLFLTDLAGTRETFRRKKSGAIWDPEPKRANGHFMRIISNREDPVKILDFVEKQYYRQYSKFRTILRASINFAFFPVYFLWIRNFQKLRERSQKSILGKIKVRLSATLLECLFTIGMRWTALNKAKRFFSSREYRIHREELKSISSSMS